MMRVKDDLFAYLNPLIADRNKSLPLFLVIIEKHILNLLNMRMT